MHGIHVNSTEKMNREKCEKTNRRSETADGEVFRFDLLDLISAVISENC